MSRVLYPVMDAIHAYGIESFAALVRENLVVGFDGLNIEVFDDASFYRVFTYAYIAAGMSGKTQDFIEAFQIDNVEPLDLHPGVAGIKTGSFTLDNDVVNFSLDDEPNDLINNDISTLILPFTLDSSEGDTVEVTSRYVELLNKELLSQTGLVSVIRSMFPGRFVDYRGDDLFSMVVVCDT